MLSPFWYVPVSFDLFNTNNQQELGLHFKLFIPNYDFITCLVVISQYKSGAIK